MNVKAHLVQKEDLKNYKKKYLKSMFIKDKLYKIYQKNITSQFHGL
jgi:hypothetical protein